MLTFLVALYVFMMFSILTVYYVLTSNASEDGIDSKHFLVGWLVFILPVLMLSMYEIVRYIWLR